MDFSNYIFQYGKEHANSNIYVFQDSNGKKLYISEKIGKFENGEVSRYLLFEHEICDMKITNYIDRKSDEFKSWTNIRPIVDNLEGILAVCQGCHTIVLKNQIVNSKGDKCVNCDLYMCKKCHKLFPLARLQDRICDNCRKEES